MSIGADVSSASEPLGAVGRNVWITKRDGVEADGEVATTFTNQRPKSTRINSLAVPMNTLGEPWAVR